MIEIKKKLEDEIKTLDYELKVQLPKEIQKAREYGDLRENAEYKAAKERQSLPAGAHRPAPPPAGRPSR